MVRRSAVLLFVVLMAACSTDGTATEAPSTTAAPTTTSAPATTSSTAPETLPPFERDDIAALIDPLVAPLGYRVSRAALIDRSTYETVPDGNHLAVYLAPIENLSVDRYAADLAPLLTVFVPYVFDRWSGLESFDVCQEPFGSTEENPPSLTLVDVTRRAVASLDWSDLDLATLIAYGDSVEDLRVWARSGVRNSATWQTAVNG